MALDEEQIGKIKLLLASSGWNDVMKPVIAKRAHDAIKALVLNPAERKGEYQGVDDTEIRARIRESEWMLMVWPNEVSVYEHNRRLEEIETQNGAANPQA